MNLFVSIFSLNISMSPLEQFDLLPIKFFFTKGGLDLTFFNIILTLFFIWFLLKLSNRWIREYQNKGDLIPKGWQRTWEELYLLILNIIKQQAGEKGKIYLPLILTLFVIILLSNLFSLLPYSNALTAHIINIFFLSFSLIGGLFIIGLKNFGVSFLKLFVPESPLLLMFILIPIEMFSYLIRCFSLAIRLSANIMAGHTLVFIVSGFMLNLTLAFQILLFTVLLAIFTLELGVAFLQAYVFVILFTIYLRDSLYEAQH